MLFWNMIKAMWRDFTSNEERVYLTIFLSITATIYSLSYFILKFNFISWRSLGWAGGSFVIAIALLFALAIVVSVSEWFYEKGKEVANYLKSVKRQAERQSGRKTSTRPSTRKKSKSKQQSKQKPEEQSVKEIVTKTKTTTVENRLAQVE